MNVRRCILFLEMMSVKKFDEHVRVMIDNAGSIHRGSVELSLPDGRLYTLHKLLIETRPVQRKIRVPLCAARTLNVTGQSRVTLSLL